MCKQYVRYVELSLRFQDTILGHLFGVSLEEGAELRILTLFKHMNADHVRNVFTGVIAELN
jgi:hypothetical protein